MSRQHINHEIVQEFRQHLTEEKPIDPVTDAVVVLSIRPPHNQENTERIRYGWELARQIAAARLGKSGDELVGDELERNAPVLILNGESECLEDILETALGLGIPPTKIRLVDCGTLAASNTKTNMQAMVDDLELSQFRHFTFVTSGYHAPRTARTAQQHLPQYQKFAVHAVPHGRFEYDVTAKVVAEIHKMQEYHAKGDIAVSAVR